MKHIHELYFLYSINESGDSADKLKECVEKISRKYNIEKNKVTEIIVGEFDYGEYIFKKFIFQSGEPVCVILEKSKELYFGIPKLDFMSQINHHMELSKAKIISKIVNINKGNNNNDFLIFKKGKKISSKNILNLVSELRRFAIDLFDHGIKKNKFYFIDWSRPAFILKDKITPVAIFAGNLDNEEQYKEQNIFLELFLTRVIESDIMPRDGSYINFKKNFLIPS